jgi:hypothetical protein
VNFTVSNSFTNATLPITTPAPGTPPGGAQNTNVSVRITTSFDGGSGFEDLTLGIVPTTSIPAAPSAPTLDAAEGPGEYTGEALDVGRKWEPGGNTRNCDPLGVDCGDAPGAAPGDPSTTYAKVTRFGDDLYFFIHVRDDYQSYAVTPAECVAHWLADSVEILIDPRGNGSQQLLDTAAAFKLGVFPFTNDPTNSNGNGANGPCWERDADNHQGYATGPLAATVADAPNAPGVQVVSSATWVGSNSTTVDHAYAGGGYNLEVKIPMADLPAAVDPQHMGLNITPYDEDNTAAAGTTTLRHIDQSTRLAWSTFGSVQSDPYRWGHATLPGYTPPADRPTTTAPPNVSHPNLDGADSPETIYQSARTASRSRAATPLLPGTACRSSARASARPRPSSTSAQPAREPRTSSSGPATTARSRSSSRAARSRRIRRRTTAYAVRDDRRRHPAVVARHERPGDPRRRRLDHRRHAARVDRARRGGARQAGRDRLRARLVRDAERRGAGVRRSLAQPTVTLSQSPDTSVQNEPVTLTADVSGTDPFPGCRRARCSSCSTARRSERRFPLDASGRATLTTSSLPVGTHRLTAVYSGDGDYAPVTSNALQHVTQGPTELLQDLSDLIDSFNLPNGKSQKFDNAVANIQRHLAAGRTKQACQALDSVRQDGAAVVRQEPDAGPVGPARGRGDADPRRCSAAERIAQRRRPEGPDRRGSPALRLPRRRRPRSRRLRRHTRPPVDDGGDAARGVSHAAPDLEAVLPADVDGHAPAQGQHDTAAVVFGRNAFGAAMTKFLEAHGKRPSDLRFANGSPTAAGPAVELGVFQVRGLDGTLLDRRSSGPPARTLRA